jgi:hypothetical protein
MWPFPSVLKYAKMYFLANLDRGSAGNTDRRKNKKKESDAAIIAVSLNWGFSGADSCGLL